MPLLVVEDIHHMDSMPGDSSRDLLIPDRWRSRFQPFKRVTEIHHPKKGHELNHQLGNEWISETKKNTPEVLTRARAQCETLRAGESSRCAALMQKLAQEGAWELQRVVGSRKGPEKRQLLLGCPRKLGSMLSKWVSSPTYKWDILGLQPTY